MNVSSVKNLNGETFSAVQDADLTTVVQTNSASWGQGGGSVDSIPFVVNSPLVTGFTGTSAYLGLDSTAIDMSPYVPYSALSDDGYGDGRVHNINNSAIYSEYADDAQRANSDSNGDDFTNNYQKISAMSDYQTSLTFAGSDNTITAINNSAIGGTMESFELSGGNNISIIDDIVNSATVISVTGISASEWNDTTNVIQANSSNWNDITAYQTNSGDYLQEVSHDNSLSGNGTVESPLGVVPGYNETVLWSGNTFSIGDGSHLSATVQLSEPISAFEEIKIISSGNLDSETIILDTSKRGGNGAFTWIAPEGSNSNWIGLRGVFTDQTHLKVYGGYSTTLASVFTGNGWWNYKNIYKVVGINRISGGNTANNPGGGNSGGSNEDPYVDEFG